MKKLATKIILLSLTTLALCRVSQSSIGLMTKFPTDYIVNEPNNVEITKSANSSYSFYQNHKIGEIEQIDNNNVTCITQNDNGDLYLSAISSKLIYSRFTIHDAKIKVKETQQCSKSICDFSKDYKQSSYGPHFLTKCSNSEDQQVYEVFDTNLNQCQSFKTESRSVAPGKDKFFIFQNEEIGYFTFSDNEKFIKIAHIPSAHNGTLRPLNNSKFIAFNDQESYQIFDLKGNSSTIESAFVFNNIPNRLFAINSNNIVEFIVRDDLTLTRSFLSFLGTYTDLESASGIPTFFYQTTVGTNTKISLVYQGLNTYSSQQDSFFYFTTSSDEFYFLRTTLKANVHGYISDNIRSFNKKRSFQVFPNGFLIYSSPKVYNPFVKFNPVNAYYFDEGEIITTRINTNKNNCSLSIVDLEQSNSTTYEFENCPKFHKIDKSTVYDKIIAYDSGTISAYILHYPYIFKATQRDVDFVLEEDFSGYDLQGYEIGEKFFVIGTPRGEKFQTMAWVFDGNSGTLIKKGKVPNTNVQVFITNGYSLTAQKLSSEKYLLTRTNLREVEKAVSRTVKGIKGIKEMVQLNKRDTIILSEDNKVFKCYNLKDCKKIDFNDELKNASISYRSCDSFILKNEVNGFGTYTTIDLSFFETSSNDVEVQSQDSDMIEGLTS